MDNYRMTRQDIITVRERLAEKIDEKFESGGPSELARVMTKNGTKTTQQNISKFILNGKLIPGWLPDAAKALGVNIEWLRYGTGPAENIAHDQNHPLPSEVTERVHVHADLEKIYKNLAPHERAKFDAIYPLIKKEMDDAMEEVAESGYALQQKNGKKN
jgi:hypothetical protein